MSSVEKKTPRVQLGAYNPQPGERENIEADLRGPEAEEGEEPYRAVVQQMAEAIYLLDVETMHLVEANPAFSRMLGYGPDEIAGLTLYDLLPYSRDRIDRTVQQLVTEGINRVRDRMYRRKDGALVSVEAGITPMTYAGKRVLCEVLRESAGGEEARQRVAVSEARFRNIFAEAPIGMATIESGYRISRANRALCEMLEYSEMELRSLTLAEITYRDDVAASMELAGKLMAGEIPQFTSEVRYVTKSGQVVWGNLRATVVNTPDGQVIPTVMITDLTERKRSEEALRNSERRLRSLIENSTEAIALLAADGNVLYVSPAVTRFLGYAPEEMEGRNAFEFAIEDEMQMAYGKLRELMDNPDTIVAVQHHYRHKDGSLRWIETTATNKLNDPAIGAIISNFRDLTESRRVQEELRRSRDQLDAILRNVREGITAQGSDGRLVYANDAALDLLGYPTQEALLAAPITALRDRFELMDENRDPLPWTELPGRQAWLGHEASEKLVGWHRKETGEERWSLVKSTPVKNPEGEVVLSITIFRDITESRKAEEALRRANRRFDLAATAVNALIYEWDLVNDKVYRSPGLFSITGFQPDEVPPTHDWWSERIHPEDLEKTQLATRMMLEQSDIYSGEYRVRHKNGNYIYVWDRGLIERDRAGKAVRAVGSTLDITGRRELEQRKDDFIALASHELKTPTSAIKGYAQLLGRDPQLAGNERILRRVKNLEVAADRLTQLVNEMLDVSRIERGQLRLDLQSLDLVALVREVAAEMRSLTDKHTIDLQLRDEDRSSTPAIVAGDTERLRQVLTNLIENAVKYSPSGGAVELAVAVDVSRVIVSVRDHGIGIPPDQIEQVFERFYRAPNASVHNFAGMGLGLSISYEIVKRHGGDMWVESTPGDGSTFSFALPCMGPGADRLKDRG